MSRFSTCHPSILRGEIMKKERIKSILYQHPEILDKAFQMPLEKADQWAQTANVSVLETIDLAKKKHPEIQEADWEVFYTALANNSNDKESAQKRRSRLPIKGWQVAAAIIVIVVLTFTLIPPARALAESVIRYIVSIFDKGIDISGEGDTIIHEPDTILPLRSADPSDENDVKELLFDDIDSFAKSTGYYPVILNSESISIERIAYYSDGLDLEWLETTYSFLDGSTVLIRQYWGNDRSMSIFQEEGDSTVHLTILDGRELTGYIRKGNDHLLAGAVLDNSVLLISWTNETDWNMIATLLSYYK